MDMDPNSNEEESERADTDYAYLVDHVYEDFEPNREEFEDVTFDSKEEFDSNEPAEPGTTPDWLLSALSVLFCFLN